MYPFARSAGVCMLAGALFLTACGAGNSGATPTPDAQTQLTSIAATVQAELTRNAALTPSATFTLAPTNTSTATPTEAATATSDGTTVATGLPGAPVSATVQPTVPDKAVYVSQTVEDGSKVEPGNDFTMSWRVKNTGTTTWSTKYQLRHFAGERFGANSSVNFPKEVKPGDEVDLTVKMTAPDSSGDHHTMWVLTNADGANFYIVDLTIQVGKEKATSTPKPTKTPTPEGSEPTATDVTSQ